MKSLLDFAFDVDKLWGSLNKETITEHILEDIQSSQFNIDIGTKVIPNQFGIYVFYIKPKAKYISIEILEQDWINKEFLNYPKVIKKRFETSSDSEEWIPFYVGKSEKVGKRIS